MFLFIPNEDTKLKIRFLITGSINTIFGYVCGVTVYNSFYDKISILLIGLISNFLSISFSFLTNKFFVFKNSKGSFFLQYLKSFLTQGLVIIIGVATLWFCITILDLSIYISQGFVVGISILLLFILHKKFTFK